MFAVSPDMVSACRAESHTRKPQTSRSARRASAGRSAGTARRRAAPHADDPLWVNRLRPRPAPALHARVNKQDPQRKAQNLRETGGENSRGVPPGQSVLAGVRRGSALPGKLQNANLQEGGGSRVRKGAVPQRVVTPSFEKKDARSRRIDGPCPKMGWGSGEAGLRQRSCEYPLDRPGREGNFCGGPSNG